MEFLWSIAGFILGWVGTNILVLLNPRVNDVPSTYLLAMGFVGALIGYTVVS